MKRRGADRGHLDNEAVQALPLSVCPGLKQSDTAALWSRRVPSSPNGWFHLSIRAQPHKRPAENNFQLDREHRQGSVAYANVFSTWE